MTTESKYYSALLDLVKESKAKYNIDKEIVSKIKRIIDNLRELPLAKANGFL